MKIISKFSDYYDHQVSYFGFDSERVYDRRATKEFPYALAPKFISEYGRQLIFHICGQKVGVIQMPNGKCYFDYCQEVNNRFNEGFFTVDCAGEAKNQEYGQPVLLEGGWKSEFYIPKLADYGFASFFPAKEMYERIYNYLGWLKDNPPIQNKQTDKEKVVSHGFDAKKSFRPKMK